MQLIGDLHRAHHLCHRMSQPQPSVLTVLGELRAHLKKVIEAIEDGSGVVGGGMLRKRIAQRGHIQDRCRGLALGPAGTVLTIRELVRGAGIDGQPREAGERGIGG